ncbi:MAG: hypothetical protein ACI4F4_01465 [Lachnospiraceae bacterium]
MKEKWIKIKRILFIVLGFCFIMGFSTPAFAYTEEQIAQARAWLSAHGYSPDRAGAAAAYQDYLNGRFDEELGRTTESTTESTSETSEEEIPDILLNPFDAELIAQIEESEDMTEETVDDATASEEEVDVAENNGTIVTADGKEIYVAGDGTIVTDEMKEQIEKQALDEKEKTQTMEKGETSQAHKDTLLVIAVSVCMMVIVEVLLYMKSMS